MGLPVPSDNRLSVTDCKFVKPKLCVTVAVNKEPKLAEGENLCWYCSVTHPQALMDRLEPARQTMTDSKYEEFKKTIEDLWTEQVSKETPCAWRQKRFWNDNVPSCRSFVHGVMNARSDANQEEEKSGAEVHMTCYPCSKIQKDTELCENCVDAVKNHGAPQLKRLILDDKCLDPKVVQELEAYLNSARA